MKKEKNPEQIKKLFEVFLIALLLVMFSYYFFYIFTSEPDYNGWPEDIGYIDDFVWVAEDGTEKEVDPEETYDYLDDGSFILKATLPQITSDNEFLAFHTLQDAEIYVDGELRRKVNLKDDVHVIGGVVKAFYVYAPLSRSDSGREVKIIRYRYRASSYKYRVPEILIGTMSEIYDHMFSRYGVAFILDVVLLIFSLLTIIGGNLLKMRLKLSVNMIYAGAAVFLTAGWMITDSYFYPFILGHNHIDGLMSYFFSMLLPLPFIAYFSSLQKDRHRAFYIGQYVLTVFVLVVASFLHFTGLVRFYEILIYMDVIYILQIMGAVYIIFREMKDGYIKSYRFTAIGLAGFILFAFLEIVIILKQNWENNGSMLLCGLIVFMIFVVVQQYEDLRVAENERRHAMELSEAKSDFLASMSHEIRTPINSILGMNEMILRENKDPVIDKYATTVQSSGRMLLSLVNDVLDFSKIEAGMLEIASETYSLSKLLADISLIAEEGTAKKELEYQLVIGDKIPDGLVSDPFRIEQVMVNLVSNAIKYTDRGSVKVDVGGSMSSDDEFMLRISVEDTGRGIKDADIKNLFDAFTRLDLKKNRSIEGTGLGLAIVKRIVDSMNGTIDVRSEYNIGSVFTVTLPQKVCDSTYVTMELIDSQRTKNGKEEHVCDFLAPDARILAVDDNAPNLSILREFLKITKAGLDTCMNGNDALKKCCETKYDIILLDHMMPDPDGIKTLSMIKNSPDSLNRETVAIVLTANVVAGSRQMYLDSGFTDYLTKPLDSSLLEEAVKKYLPEDKIVPAGEREDQPAEDADGEIMEFEGIKSSNSDPDRVNFDVIPMVDSDIALKYANNSHRILKLVIDEIVNDAPEKTEEMKNAIKDRDFDTYRIGAHSIKSMMATIGAQEMSELAKKHEFAVKENNTDIVLNEGEAFLAEYEDMCKKLAQAIGR